MIENTESSTNPEPTSNESAFISPEGEVLDEVKVITNKNESIPEEIWNTSLLSLVPASKIIMDFNPPLLISLRKLEYGQLFISAWDSQKWSAFKEWRERNKIEEINGKYIELWLQEYIKARRIFLLQVAIGVSDGADSRDYHYYIQK